MQTAAQVASGRPLDNTKVFGRDQPEIYVTLDYMDALPGTAVTATLVLLTPAGPIVDSTVTFAPAHATGFGAVKFTMPPGGWREGRYRCDLTVGGIALLSVPLEVKALK